MDEEYLFRLWRFDFNEIMVWQYFKTQSGQLAKIFGLAKNNEGVLVSFPERFPAIFTCIKQLINLLQNP